MAANQADTDTPLDTSDAGAVPYLSYPIPGIAHAAIPGLLGVALNGQAPPSRWFAADDGSIQPTKRGLSIGLKHLPRIAEETARALDFAREHGLIEDQASDDAGHSS
jgi:hypothetical protein